MLRANARYTIALQCFMNIQAAVEQIQGWAETDWTGLWEIVAYVQEELDVDDSVEAASARLLTLAVAVIIVLGTNIFLLNRLIERRLERSRRLKAWTSSSES